MLVGYGATAKHCAFFLMSNQTTKTHAADLQGYDLSTGTIRFQPERPLPTVLVQKLVRARQAENATRLAGKAQPASRKGTKKSPAKTSREGGPTAKSATKPVAMKKAKKKGTKKSTKAARKSVKKSTSPKAASRQRGTGKTKPKA
jgi:hypothetical protein